MWKGRAHMSFINSEGRGKREEGKKSREEKLCGSSAAS